MKIKMNVFNAEGIIPERAHYNDAGADVFTPYVVTILPHQTVTIPLGYGLEIPDGYMACVYPKTSLASKGIITHIPPIDSGYSGEINAIITNTTDTSYKFNSYDKVGQIIVHAIVLPEFVLELGKNRGAKGFGSTGR